MRDHGSPRLGGGGGGGGGGVRTETIPSVYKARWGDRRETMGLQRLDWRLVRPWVSKAGWGVR